MSLISISEKEFKITLDLKYATKDNFVKEKLYKNAECFLQSDAAEKLKKAADRALELGYSLKIFDAFRPIEVQKYIWHKYEDERFISNPYTGAVPHCRGIAVDLTLLDENGNELDMGTGFDDFTKKSFHANNEIPLEAQKNRLLLLAIMTESGWDFYHNEWWHYQLFKPREFKIID